MILAAVYPGFQSISGCFKWQSTVRERLPDQGLAISQASFILSESQGATCMGNRLYHILQSTMTNFGLWCGSVNKGFRRWCLQVGRPIDHLRISWFTGSICYRIFKKIFVAYGRNLKGTRLDKSISVKASAKRYKGPWKYLLSSVNKTYIENHPTTIPTTWQVSCWDSPLADFDG